VVHPPDLPKIQNPQSKIRNPKSKNLQSKIQNPNFSAGFWGFWILHFGSLCSNSSCEAPTQILDFGGGFWILDSGFWILAFGFRILDFGFWILSSDFGFWISDFRFWSWISEHYVADLFVQILDFGFWILGQILDST